LENKDLFGHIHSNDGKYNCRKHFAQMIALLGHPPQELLDREREARNWKWEPPIENSEGRICTSVDDYFGGPFFNSDGKIFLDYTLVISIHTTILTTLKASSYIKTLFQEILIYGTVLHLYKGKKDSYFWNL
jgi:hypothetical protein